MKKIIDYLKEKYNPLAIVTYGSFSCGMNDSYSDYDCMIIVNTIVMTIPLLMEFCWIALFSQKTK